MPIFFHMRWFVGFDYDIILQTKLFKSFWIEIGTLYLAFAMKCFNSWLPSVMEEKQIHLLKRFESLDDWGAGGDVP